MKKKKIKTITKRLCCTIKVQLNLFFIVVVYYVSAQCCFCVCKNVSNDALDAFCIVGSNSHEYSTNYRIGKSIGERVWLSKEQFHIAVSCQLLLLGTYIYTCLLTYMYTCLLTYMYTDHIHIHIRKYIYIYIYIGNYIVGHFFCMMVIVNFNCCIVKVL